MPFFLTLDLPGASKSNKQIVGIFYD
uniref:Uncharacterized protein n=1 Tax=Arundo donax TaxID=35708 RepID=A0A0A9HLL6_ARUDO